MAGVNDRAAELTYALECRLQIGDGEVRKGRGIARAGSTVVDSKPQAIRVGLPTRSGRRWPWREADPEDSVPELEGAIGIVGWEFDQRRGHGRSMATVSCSLLLRATNLGPAEPRVAVACA
jgi:hypothetical protein